MTKNEIIDSLYKIMCSGTSTAVDSRVENNDYFKRRVLGFKAEIEFEKLVNKNPNVSFLEGGQFISKKLNGRPTDRNKFIYSTVSYDKPDDYLEIYDVISKWDEVIDMVYIQTEDKDWRKETFLTRAERGGDKKEDFILTPSFVFYSYDKDARKFTKAETNSFSAILKYFDPPQRTPNLYHLRKREQFDFFDEYDIEILEKIYANRYYLDVIMRNAQGRQIIDLDGFLISGEEIRLIEIKEKSPIKPEGTINNKESWQYGWDSRRILWYLYLLKKVKLEILYCVRQIKDRNDREFIKWDSISIDDFLRGTSWSSSRGGGGGEDTLLSPYLFFEDLEDKIKVM